MAGTVEEKAGLLPTEGNGNKVRGSEPIDHAPLDIETLLARFAATEDPYLAIEQLLAAIGSIDDRLAQRNMGNFAKLMRDGWEDADLLKFGRDLLMNSTHPRQQDALAMSLLMYSGKEAGRVEGLGPDLLRVYDATDDVILRANIASNMMNTWDPNDSQDVAQRTFDEEPDANGLYPSWLGFETLMWSYKKNRKRVDDPVGLRDRFADQILRAAVTNRIDLRSFESAVNSLYEVDPSRLRELRNRVDRIAHPNHLDYLDRTIEAMDAKKAAAANSK